MCVCANPTLPGPVWPFLLSRMPDMQSQVLIMSCLGMHLLEHTAGIFVHACCLTRMQF